MDKVRYKFNHLFRYITRGIKSQLPLELQIIIWNIIDNHVANDIEIDYLQVFSISCNHHNLIIVHHQECPPYKKIYEYPQKKKYNAIVNRKIYVIDDISHSTMLWSSEY